MSWSKWAPLRYIISKAAQRQGFLDPIELLARMRNFAQPSEVGEPIELLRAGVIFHARGLINSKVIQYNLDWIWPYWIQRQYDPRGDSFIPRAFSASHINLTHRNWTAIGYPDSEQLPLVDPRGLLTPLYDGWSLDAWILTRDGRYLLPCKSSESTQQLHTGLGLGITTRTVQGKLSLTSNAHVELVSNEKSADKSSSARCLLHINAQADTEGYLVLALRPCNPEGISFINSLKLAEDRRSWLIEGEHRLGFNLPVAKNLISDYYHGDVFLHLQKAQEKTEASCKAGMLTAAALFPLGAEHQLELQCSFDLPSQPSEKLQANSWPALRKESCRLHCPDSRFQFLYDAAVSSLILHSPGDVYPGPYTYKRFWFRDAAYIIHALLCLGLNDRAWRALSKFQERQTVTGYFRSQEGEWDANGEVLWILRRYEQFTGKKLPDSWHSSIRRGAQWIINKRLPETPDSPHAGLLPPGFSAEHLGPNDYYYWDDFWCIAGLGAAAELLSQDSNHSSTYAKAAEDFKAAVARSLQSCRERLQRPAMPASPYRRLDAGAVGSLAVGYPLQNCAPTDPALLDTVEFMLSDCFVEGAFFQDMIHSGLNAYLTLHVAQILLRAGDARYLELMDRVAALATSTGQWPEAIHPSTLGGCMGDGHHVWAAAEWVLMIRNCFVREEGDTLILCAGIPQRWLDGDSQISFGPAPTAFGSLFITVMPDSPGQITVLWQAEWHRAAPHIEVHLPGFAPMPASRGANSLVLTREVETA